MRPAQKTHFARRLRRGQSDAEAGLWAALRSRGLMDCKFRRQVPIGPYVVDFVCLSKRLVVEIDGGQHALQGARDAGRTAFLAERGYRVLRFWNNDVLMQRGAVLQAIAQALAVRCPHPNPVPPVGKGTQAGAHD
ncbi:endonuclease domain-containing protein [Thermomonas sp.]|uniref:endonuclease domain-containing protein n=1 Tax=Thermomonas sp. TaxID=1971895 RepID=UPI0035B021C5